MSAVRLPTIPAETPARPASAFATTHWSLVLNAADTNSTASHTALEELCRIYWPALYAFARRRGQSPQDAEDLTQGFFADILARGAIAHADGERGRFRTFLLTSFQNYASHQRARAGRHKRGGNCEIIPLEALVDAEGHFLAEPATQETPERHFDRQWARQLIERALAVVKSEYAEANKSELFAALKDSLMGGLGERGYAESAARLGATEGSLKVAMHRLRHRFSAQLRFEVARTVADPGEIEAEIRYLLAAFEG